MLQLSYSKAWYIVQLKASKPSALGNGASCSLTDGQGRG